jgi:hypothetical protein
VRQLVSTPTAHTQLSYWANMWREHAHHVPRVPAVSAVSPVTSSGSPALLVSVLSLLILTNTCSLTSDAVLQPCLNCSLISRTVLHPCWDLFSHLSYCYSYLLVSVFSPLTLYFKPAGTCSLTSNTVLYICRYHSYTVLHPCWYLFFLLAYCSSYTVCCLPDL